MLSRTTLAVVALFAVLAAFVYITQVRNQPAAGAAAKPALLVFGTLKQSDLTSLQVQQGSATIKLNRAANGTWTLVQPASTYTDTTRVVDTVSQLVAATKERSIALAGANLHQYGLDAPWLTATLTEAKGQQVLLIGGLNVDSTSRYAQLKGAKYAFLLSTGTADALAALVKTPPIATPTVPATPIPTLPPSAPSVTATPTP